MKMVLLLILQKVKDHDIMLNEIKGNIFLLNQKITSHSMISQLLDGQIDQVVSCIYSNLRTVCLVIVWLTLRMRF